MTIIQFIDALRATDPYIETIYTRGGCYQFARLLQQMYGGHIVINSEGDHAGLAVLGTVYDINGVNDTEEWDDPTEEELEEMKCWSFFRMNALKIKECPACEEPITA
jgi:hypothetical protein